ncbi:cysteine hydrolase family protein [Amphibacillus cookii]|uniref:cysteine hydrolase family protein n=1 Tax=Amphibacillus cookii TaxID=767787 RepID=UPI00195DCF15|nr:cysteine hydrolase [Amphibacillus cookii]MBM7540717.1 nicotinamidase-related amidase [Amphibacillus cookii]
MHAYYDGEKRLITDEIIFEQYLDPKKTAVITIDMHEGHLSDDPDCPAPSPRGKEIIEPINKFVTNCRSMSIPIIHVRSVLRRDGSDDINGNKSAWRIMSSFREQPPENLDAHGIEGSKWIEFSVDVQPSDYQIDSKKRLSAFYVTDLELLLRNIKKETIILVGALTDCCVLNTSSDGANRDFRVVVPKDLTRGNAQLEASALQIIARYFGLVVESDDLLAHWAER